MRTYFEIWKATPRVNKLWVIFAFSILSLVFYHLGWKGLLGYIVAVTIINAIASRWGYKVIP